MLFREVEPGGSMVDPSENPSKDPDRSFDEAACGAKSRLLEGDRSATAAQGIIIEQPTGPCPWSGGIDVLAKRLSHFLGGVLPWPGGCQESMTNPASTWPILPAVF
ncbi:hypothetical protein KM043_007206 [Ampulex compressa]|nr:hypothetical protein KM043_007206 [Ampulex compressa]